MINLQAIIDRLKARVPDLGNRVEDVGALAALTASGGVPGVTPIAHVVPGGIAGGKHVAQTGSYVQAVDRQFSVVLTLRTQDPSGKRAMSRLAELIDEIIAALAGWDIGALLGVVQFRRSTLIGADRGAFSYDIQFSVTDQLRIIPS